jgi:hypothetical protein
MNRRRAVWTKFSPGKPTGAARAAAVADQTEQVDAEDPEVRSEHGGLRVRRGDLDRSVAPYATGSTAIQRRTPPKAEAPS